MQEYTGKCIPQICWAFAQGREIHTVQVVVPTRKESTWRAVWVCERFRLLPFKQELELRRGGRALSLQVRLGANWGWVPAHEGLWTCVPCHLVAPSNQS